MKYLKIFVLLLMSMFIFSTNVSASKGTVAGLRKELEEQRRTYNEASSNSNKSKAEINAAKNRIYNSQEEIKKNETAINKAKIEIETLNLEIAKTDEDIKKYLNTLQETSSNNLYLEFILDAKDYADLVYRYAIIEQLASHDKEKINSYENKIIQNKELQIELTNREKELQTQIASLEKEVVSLGKEYNKFVEIELDTKKELDATQVYIDHLVSIGCGETEEIISCIGLNGDTGFTRPVPYGTITSYYGWRTSPLTGAPGTWHGGLDIGGMREGSNIYPIANGIVVKIITKSGCGGNMVYINHNIGGKLYTSAYYHLLNIKVKTGDLVTRNSVVGGAGGWPASTPWDSCSTGTHLHLVLAHGWYGSKCEGDCYSSPSTFNAKSVNPRDYISFPNKGSWFNTR